MVKKKRETFITKCFFTYASSTHSNGGFIFAVAFSNSWLVILIKQKLWESDTWSVKGVKKIETTSIKYYILNEQAGRCIFINNKIAENLYIFHSY